MTDKELIDKINLYNYTKELLSKIEKDLQDMLQSKLQDEYMKKQNLL